MTRLAPAEIVNLVLRNAIPVIGLLFFHWSAANLLILYFVDTLLAFAVIFAGYLYSQFPADAAPGLAARLNTIVGYAAAALFVALILAVPLGMPVFILVFGASDASLTGMLRDPGFQLGLALQAIASLISFRDLAVALRTYTPEQLGLKRRFTFVLLRWIGTMMAAYFSPVYLLGRFAPLALVAVYIGLTIFAELRPDRFLAAFGDMARDIENSGTTPARAGKPASRPDTVAQPGGSAATAAQPQRGRRRRHQRR